MKEYRSFEALSRIFLIVKRARQASMRPHGISLKQFYVLGQLDRREALTPSQVAELIFSDRPTATVVIRNIENKGWVERQRDPRDARRFLLGLSESGRRKLQEIRKSDPFDDLPLSQVFGCLNREEKLHLGALLDRVYENVARLSASREKDGMRGATEMK